MEALLGSQEGKDSSHRMAGWLGGWNERRRGRGRVKVSRQTGRTVRKDGWRNMQMDVKDGRKQATTVRCLCSIYGGSCSRTDPVFRLTMASSTVLWLYLPMYWCMSG